ncbi:hypothetical protein [Halorussus halobius]|uniref:hypothetical protein n=1 Tax=Halorussus halobius TaxID=1710537 RepID=UPI00109280FB|nr:hypothetical protein [Halorussus halobius]
MSKAVVRVALVALLVVSAGIPAGAGTAVAAEKGNCSNLDDFVMFLTLGAVNAEDCSRAAYVDDAIQDMKESDASQEKVDIYSAGTGLQAGSEAWSAPFDNYLNDTESVAWMKVETAVAEAYQDGASQAEAEAEARKAIADYYAVKQINLIEQWNTTMKQIMTLEGQSEMEDGISSDFVSIEQAGNESTWGGDEPNKFHETSDFYNRDAVSTLELVNGSHRDHYYLTHDAAYDDNSWMRLDGGDGWKNGDVVEVWVTIEAPNQNFEAENVTAASGLTDRWNRIETMNDQLQTEAENFVAATYSDFESGQINASDVVSANTAMFEYGVRGANESEGLYQSTAALSLMGYQTPNMSTAGTMTVRYQNQNYTGLVLAENAPNGSWETGVQYDTANIEGPVFMATANSSKIDFAEGETFTILSMTAKDGSEVETQETTQYNYRTANTNELLKKQQELLELRQEIENREPDSGGGGGFGDGSVPMWVGAALAGGVVLLVVLRE